MVDRATYRTSNVSLDPLDNDALADSVDVSIYGGYLRNSSRELINGPVKDIIENFSRKLSDIAKAAKVAERIHALFDTLMVLHHQTGLDNVRNAAVALNERAEEMGLPRLGDTSLTTRGVKRAGFKLDDVDMGLGRCRPAQDTQRATPVPLDPRSRGFWAALQEPVTEPFTPLILSDAETDELVGGRNASILLLPYPGGPEITVRNYLQQMPQNRGLVVNLLQRLTVQLEPRLHHAYSADGRQGMIMMQWSQSRNAFVEVQQLFPMPGRLYLPDSVQIPLAMQLGGSVPTAATAVTFPDI